MWLVGEEKVRITAPRLLEILLKRQLDSESQPADQLSREFITFLTRKEGIANVSLVQLAYMSFRLGYYYRVFITQNKVQYESNDGNTDSANQSSTQPPNQASS